MGFGPWGFESPRPHHRRAAARPIVKAGHCLMAWFPDSNWLKALDMRGSTAAAVTVASVAVLVLAEAGALRLGSLPDWARVALAIAAIFSFAILCAKVWDWYRDRQSERQRVGRSEAERLEEAQRAEEARMQAEREVLGYLDTLSPREREILSYLVQMNQQSFTCNMAGERIAPLKQKGLVQMASGVHTQMNWPFTVPNFVWAELQRRKAEFNTADLKGAAPPWVEPW